MSVGVAFKAFFAALFQREASDRIRAALAGESPKAETPKIEEKKKQVDKAEGPARSEALTMLSTLQREARLLDLVYESLDGFEDAQVGAAAREVISECRKTLDRMFAIEPLSDEDEGAAIEIPPQASPNRFRLIGGESGRGSVAHRGWRATRCELPKWAGKRDEAWVLAPTEIEVG